MRKLVTSLFISLDGLVTSLFISLEGIVEADNDRQFAYLVSRARAFDGCIDLAITADTLDPRRINNLEALRDSAALDSWRGQADPPDTGTEPSSAEMKRYDATDGGPLF